MQVHCITLHRLFRRLQQKNKFIGRVERTGLSLVETHFLLELQADPTLTISRMAVLLGVDQSFSSRVASQLQRKQLIESKESRTDSRKRELSISRTGSSMIKKIDRLANGLINQFQEGISAREFQKLSMLLEAIADGYKQPPGKTRPGESSYRVQQRRVTRSFGLLGNHVFGSALSSSHWQTLTEVSLSPVPPRITELATLLGLAQNSLSTVIQSLETQGLLKRVQLSSDKRVQILESTPKGRKLCTQIEQHAARDISAGLQDFKDSELEELVGIVQRFVGETDGVLPPLLPEFSVYKNESEKLRSAAREFAVKFLAKNPTDFAIPERLFPASGDSFSLFEKDRLVAVLDLIGDDPADRRVHFAIWNPKLTPWCMTGFLNRVAILTEAPFPLSLTQFIQDSRLKNFLHGKPKRNQAAGTAARSSSR